MYCSTCGNKVAEHLNYCNSCGVRIEKNALVLRNSASPQLAKSLTIVGGFGFIGFIGVLKMLLDSGGRLDTAAIVLILLAYLATLFLICAMMVGHMWKNAGDIRVKQREAKEPEDYVSPALLQPLNTAQLEESRQRPASVTEHTTRTLENVSVPRNQS